MADAPVFTPVTWHLQPAFHQVGGHMTKDEVPESYVDDNGIFYKPFMADPRAMRELTFYRSVYAEPGQPRPHIAYPAPDGLEAPPTSAEPKAEDIEGLKPFLPKFNGVFEYEGHKLIAMEDMCKPYKKACVMDCKMGYTTVYPWGPEKYVTKNSAKDLENTSSTVGFRVSGLRCYRPAEGEMFKPDRHWGKTLNADNIGSAFELFASGALSPKELYGDAEFGVLTQLRKLQQWVHSQTSVQMYQASVLIMYEGDCTRMADANVRVAVVDFAHTFQSLGQKDENWIKALDNLISIVEKVAAA